MEDFFPELLDEFVSTDFLKKVRVKYHFDEKQAAEIQAAAEEMLPQMRQEAFWVKKKFFAKKEWQSEDSDTAYENVAMSLGAGVDLLQESYSEKGMLLESYMVEVLASELLMRSYDAYNRYVMHHSAYHVARYHFPGSEEALPLEMLPQLLSSLTQKITCNSAFCMQPKKSVVFISELTQDETLFCKGICVGCTNTACPNRTEDDNLIRKRMTDLPLTYGYSRIFGIHK
ncbi:MAG: hypothetical protein K2O59_15220 [Lachnospiraceae bacterium]|nr:hypothetical protein [Lachnospiraceae bacterium]